jgi:hypothetical protein
MSLFVVALLMWAAPAHAAKGDCSQPSTTGTGPAASDCLFILRVAVGSLTCTPACICAPSGTLPAKSSDALRCLRNSVGQDVSLDCPCGDVPDGDDFNDNTKDPERWGSDIVFFGSGVLSEASGRLEFEVASETGEHYTARPWVASLMPYTADWETQVDLTNLSVPDENDELTSYGISVFDENDLGSEVFVELYASHFDNPPARNGFYGAISNSGDFVADVDSLASDQSVTDAAVRITFDADTKVLTLYYDADSTDGYVWTSLASFSVDGNGGVDGNTNWGMTADDRFSLALYGYAEQMAVGAGVVYSDNFQVTGGVTP